MDLNGRLGDFILHGGGQRAYIWEEYMRRKLLKTQILQTNKQSWEDGAVKDDTHIFLYGEGFLLIPHSDKILKTPSVLWQILCQLDINYSHLRGRNFN